MDEIENIFQQADFSSENIGLETRIWNRLMEHYKETIDMPIDKTKITKEMLEKASKCNNAEELMALAKAGGFKITKTEAEAYLAELENMELDEATLEKVTGGGKPGSCQVRMYSSNK